MASIRSKDTKLETNFLKTLSAKIYPLGYRYRKHCKKITGSPDIAFISKRLAIFLDGDFWHGRNFTKLMKRLPKGFWQNKISRNVARDKKTNLILKKEGWIVLRFWEGQILKDPDCCIDKILRKLKKK